MIRPSDIKCLKKNINLRIKKKDIMKKSFYLIAGIAMAFLALFSSCRKVNPINPSGIHEVTLNASTEDASKTYLSGYDVLWSSGDKINVNGSEFNLVSGAGTKNAVFHGTASGSSFLAGYKAKSNNGTTVTFEIPADQSGYTATMDGKLPMVGYAASENDKLKFKNVVNIIKIALTGASTDVVTKIELSSTANLTGEFTATSSCVPTSIATGGKVITVNLNSGITLSGTAQYVYVMIPKLAAESSINVKFTGTKSSEPAKFNCTIDKVPGSTVNKIYTANITANLDPVPYFTVNSSGKKVEFSPGNLYYNGSTDTYSFESPQTYFTPKVEKGEMDPNHVCHFYYHHKAARARAATMDWTDSWDKQTNKYNFTNETATTPNPNFTVAGETGVWRSLSYDEFFYIINNNSKCGTATVNGQKGLLLCPDTYPSSGWVYPTGGLSGTFSFNVSDATWVLMESKGCVFMPLAGARVEGSQVTFLNNNGTWLCLNFSDYDIENNRTRAVIVRGDVWYTNNNAGHARSMRLVQDY